MDSGAFASQKKEALNNLLAAEKVGDLDQDLKPLLDAINSLPDCYTTSSCSGRIVLFQNLGGKSLDKTVGKWHRKVQPDDVFRLIQPMDGVVNFIYEPPILHIMARTLEKAAVILILSREAGFKRTGIQSLRPERILVEALSTERIDAPIMAAGKTLVSDEYLRFLIQQANAKYDGGQGKLQRLLVNLQRLR
jgi:tRNA wybutosine-synthesizing protein 3